MILDWKNLIRGAGDHGRVHHYFLVTVYTPNAGDRWRDLIIANDGMLLSQTTYLPGCGSASR